MKLLKKTLLLTVLLFLTQAAATQSFHKISNQPVRMAGELVATPDPVCRSSNLSVRMAGELTATPDPAYRNSNSMLSRRISIRPDAFNQKVNTFNTSAYVPVFRAPAGNSLAGGSSSAGGNFTQPAPMTPPSTGNDVAQTGSNGVLDMGNGNDDDDDEDDNGLGGNLHPGQFTPLGSSLIPLLLMLLCYALFRLVRGDVREEQEMA